MEGVERLMTSQVVESRDRRIGKSIAMLHSCEVYKLAGEKETYKVQSESNKDRFYIVKFIDSTPRYCTCKDWEQRSKLNPDHLCKHMRVVVLADQHNLIKEEEEEPEEADAFATEETAKEAFKEVQLEYERDEYSF
jgi:predicted MPP superfamily phosphohydrolase